jgi:hypothetical protein
MDEEDLIPEDTSVGAHFRCYCGEMRLETTLPGNPPKCMGCPECHSTLATSKEKCEQMTLHQWDNGTYTKTCKKCLTQEIIESKFT